MRTSYAAVCEISDLLLPLVMISVLIIILAAFTIALTAFIVILNAAIIVLASALFFFSGQTESTNTLVEGGIAESSAFYLVNSDTTKDVNEKEVCSDMVEQQNERVDPTSAGERGEGGLVTITAGQFRRDVRGRRIEVDRDHRSGDQVPIIKAFEKVLHKEIPFCQNYVALSGIQC